eukprot:TRINITY_DN4215_c0_g1_i1.p1 TRINITY_DN4215_c0_g1~~TRINITY_DN4215_c0_g1_i1.p1  ORF type:complete len:293 (+),score=22.79 TRINITY_DN4215_c0_g1_i1:73-951(+)
MPLRTVSSQLLCALRSALPPRSYHRCNDMPRRSSTLHNAATHWNVTHAIPEGAELHLDSITEQQEQDILHECAALDYRTNEAHLRREKCNILSGRLKTMPATKSAMDQATSKHALPPTTTAQVNRYAAGGGLPFHVDARSIGASIAMLSLQSHAVLELVKANQSLADIDVREPLPTLPWTTPTERRTSDSSLHLPCSPDDWSHARDRIPDAAAARVLLPPRSLLILRGPSRYLWAHRVPYGDTYWTQDAAGLRREVPRLPRTSIVFWNASKDECAPPLSSTVAGTGRIRLMR